jgi:2-hydroxychromene-2-carboxylate isomerase
LPPIAARYETPIVWRPFLVGGVFNEVNKAVYAARENPTRSPKGDYYAKDLRDWARYTGLTINFPPSCGHPVNAVKVMRACIAVEPQGKLVPFAKAAFEALWRDERDLGKEEVVADICRIAGVDPDLVLAEIGKPAIKDQLRANTDEAIARGAFGAPTFFVDETDFYFGNDRIPLIEAALKQARER